MPFYSNPAITVTTEYLTDAGALWTFTTGAPHNGGAPADNAAVVSEFAPCSAQYRAPQTESSRIHSSRKMIPNLSMLSLLLSATIGVAARAWAGNVVELPSDVSVSLFAEPTMGLVPGDSVGFTISVTNNGPEPVDRLTVVSSFFVDQFDAAAGSISACEGPLGVSVSDFIGGYEYWISWDPVTYTDPALITLDVGETRTCHFSMPLTSAAPYVYPFSFGLAGFLSDLDSSNDSAEVVLNRAPSGVTATSVPTLSLTALGLLAGLLALVVGVHHRVAR